MTTHGTTEIIFRDHFRYNGAHNSVEGERRILDNLLKDRGPGKRQIVARKIYVSYDAPDGSVFELRDGAVISDVIEPTGEEPDIAIREPTVCTSPVIDPAFVGVVRTFPDVLHEYEPNVLATVVDAMEGIELLMCFKHSAY